MNVVLTIGSQPIKLLRFNMRTIEADCYVYKSGEHEGFYAAEILSGEYGDILCLARDPIRAQGFAWRELGERMIKRTQTRAYKAAQGEIV